MEKFATPPTHVVLHHTEVHSVWPHGVSTIRTWHRKRGFDDIGYHHVVRRSGLWEIGRPEAYRGAHCRDGGMNRRGIAVCMEGHFDKQAVAKAQRGKTVALIAFLCSRYGIGPDHVIGHRKAGSSKTCPGKHVDMDRYRALVANALAEVNVPA